MAIAVPVNDGVAGPRASSVTAIVFGSIVAATYPREHLMPASFFGGPPHEGSSSSIPAVIRRLSLVQRTLSGANSVSCAKRSGAPGLARENATTRFVVDETT